MERIQNKLVVQLLLAYKSSSSESECIEQPVWNRRSVVVVVVGCYNDPINNWQGYFQGTSKGSQAVAPPSGINLTDHLFTSSN